MKRIDDVVYLTIGEVAKMIERGPQTIKNWYAWQDKEQTDILPSMHTDLDAKGTRYFKETDIPLLIHFRDNIKYGMMADFNRDKWGIRGQEIKNQKEEKI